MKFERNRKLGHPSYGVYDIVLPEPPAHTEIANHNLKKEDQYWRPTKVPKDFKNLDIEAQKKFYSQELKRRRDGFFFYNNGNIEYVTGVHYFYLCYWNLDIGLPYFCDADRDFFYLWDAVVQSPDCYGLLDTENRRGGKTSRGICIIYEYVSKTFYAKGGIQSKTNIDSKKVFLKLVQSWKRMDPIWRPTDTGETSPSTALRFSEPSGKSSKGKEKVYKDVLNSIIDFAPAVEEAYDGDKIHRLYNDEVGKTTEVNIYTRWQIQKFCLRKGMEIIGKSPFTTTVEEMTKKGGANYKKLWDESDPGKLGADGKTTSGLWRYFKPAYYGLEGFIDKYGYSVIETPEKPVIGNDGKMITEGAKTALLKEREGKTGQALYDLIRKQPFTITEAFMTSDKSDVFPAFKIHEQKRHNETIYEPLYRVGNFEWVDTEQKKVSFFDNENGRWKVAWLPPEDLKNNKEVKRNGISPGNKSLGLLGVDPYDHSTTVGDRMSNAAMYLFRTFNPAEPLKSRCFVLEYINRPPIVDILYDDIIKTAVFYGVEIFVETQKPGLINYANRMGFGNYIKKINHADVTQHGADKMHQGLSTAGTYVRESLMSNTVTFIYDSIGRLSEESQQKRGIVNFDPTYHGFCPFDELLNQWLEFDIKDWTKYDAVVASSIAILGTVNLTAQKKEKQSRNIGDYFNTFGIR